MKTRSYDAKINGRWVRGQAHLRSDGEPWIGNFRVANDLLEGDFDEWESTEVQYKGPFLDGQDRKNGKSLAKVVSVKSGDERHVQLLIEGTEKPELLHKTE